MRTRVTVFSSGDGPNDAFVECLKLAWNGSVFSKEMAR